MITTIILKAISMLMFCAGIGLAVLEDSLTTWLFILVVVGAYGYMYYSHKQAKLTPDEE